MKYRFLSTLSTDVHEHLEETVVEMVHLFGISEAEAVARINAAWSGSEFIESSKLILHEYSVIGQFSSTMEEVFPIGARRLIGLPGSR